MIWVVCQLQLALHSHGPPSGRFCTAAGLFAGRPDSERVAFSEQHLPLSSLTGLGHPASDWVLKATAPEKVTWDPSLSVALASCFSVLGSSHVSLCIGKDYIWQQCFCIPLLCVWVHTCIYMHVRTNTYTRDLVLYLILWMCLDLFIFIHVRGGVCSCVCIYSVFFNCLSAETL